MIIKKYINVLKQISIDINSDFGQFFIHAEDSVLFIVDTLKYTKYVSVSLKATINYLLVSYTKQ
ncbi:MAG: hypothetical protein HXN77_01290 [Prevotella pallens]|uniref:hypothetical protein n=1 Tax=Prevotella pallens TaxID=60133 RepID=UPI001CAB48EE|nr:hypothetical protein [Prevotella pallens]MBF1489128.1 hypothetical protein [Prevotella pallens]